ncbi:two-component system regulatory protein YycI [Salisediminibacterium halotolerans]|uniref:two-component system regulatory protein YycI n=1 Tax=Salisediminibacterium halotolerans TaxID=517425 RepID=UPI000EAF4CFE|nr:two-component system regulatory protein YycI [Salisediminibacterium halotolerans]RLJ69708.1 regulatory protein YycI of two-component signal transduction system YycFG [Actinophytocola xinjiangensis]RPE89766.1 regulatory protein YycI of two-component signal transduction system YycFG [Salisediminibacterium halotolerans]TWG32602.1 regulatory protein YycI of two-component signal transduction system YycFG [Salisediminibacterium halotolerans]GEL09111.1 hypothetical protein SHA02_25270 [Salisedimini
MDWSKTKSIFIVTFLLLNIFLGFQLYSKMSGDNLAVMTETTLEDRLETNNIEMRFDDEDENIEAGPITVSPRTFDERFLAQETERQDIEMLNEHTIYSLLEQPYQLVDANLSASVDAFTQQYIYEGEQYEIAEYNEEEDYIGLYQTHEGRKIDEYERENYHVVLHLNEDMQVQAYLQTMVNVSEQDRVQELLSPIEVVERLFNQQHIRMNTVVEDAELRYYSLVEPDADFQVYAPVWRIEADDEWFFVDAQQGELQTIQSME